jgi:hypothetical protein
LGRHSSGQVTPIAWTRLSGTVWLRVSSSPCRSRSPAGAVETRKSQSSSTRRTGCTATPIKAVIVLAMPTKVREPSNVNCMITTSMPTGTNQACGVSS